MSFDSFNNGLKLIKILLRTNFINFRNHKLHINVIFVTSLQKKIITLFKAMLEIDAYENLTKPRRNL